ncbi:MAG: hypothetical protein KGS72_19915 [Cyanobacteria bacterium REEB67]|nr:hypothetical protein [Cyanobacteria bacterium REEB67]
MKVNMFVRPALTLAATVAASAFTFGDTPRAEAKAGDSSQISGKLIGHPFSLVKATCAGTTITLDGGDIVSGDPSKGRNKIVISFPASLGFFNQTYQVPYNATRALLAKKGDVKAPTITYTGLDKSGALVTRTATNGSKSDELDYAMELQFNARTKAGDPNGHLKLQIGSEPVTDLRGDFVAVH